MPKRKRGMVRCNGHQFITIDKRNHEDDMYKYQTIVYQCYKCGYECEHTRITAFKHKDYFYKPKKKQERIQGTSFNAPKEPKPKPKPNYTKVDNKANKVLNRLKNKMRNE